MNVLIGKKFEKLVVEKVKSGLYSNPSDVVRDALRHTFCEPLDIDEDTPELKEFLRQGLESPRSPYQRNDLEKVAARVRRELKK